MDIQFRDHFTEQWRKYFLGEELPIVYFYADDPGDARKVPPAKMHECIICDLAKVRSGQSLAFNESAISCNGGKRYLGFSNKLRHNFEYFLSYGIPGEMEGERYIRTPEMVKQLVLDMRQMEAGAKYIIFKRWDHIAAEDEPAAAIFFAKPDVLSGLFTLANYDQVMGDGVTAHFGSGCGTIIHQSWIENEKENPRALLGMFDVSARPCVPANVLSFAVPIKKFRRMVSYMDESFLITESWNKVMGRLDQPK
jgi:hypothetical protein